MKNNYSMEAKIAILKSGYYNYQIAQKLNMRPQNFSRMLRYGISKEKKELIEKIIQELNEEKWR